MRAWPKSGPSESRLQQIRAYVELAHRNSFRLLPGYLTDGNGQTFVWADDRFWELTQWMPGEADYLRFPSSAKLKSALQALAHLHSVWSVPSERGISPAVQRRVELLGVALNPSFLGQLHALARVLSSRDARAELLTRTADSLARHGEAVLRELHSIQQQPVAQHFVLRDIWSDHILFLGENVSGIIDLGAARIDEPATDVARLLGSMEPVSVERWMAGLDAYRERQPSVDPKRVASLDRASCLLSAVQWARWLGLEGRAFSADRNSLLERWKGFLDRLEFFSWSRLATPQ